MTDTLDNMSLATTINSPPFQDRCRLRFLFYALNTVMGEAVSAVAASATVTGNVLHLVSAVGIVQGMAVSDLFGNVIPVGAVVESVSGSNVTISGSVTGSGVLINDVVNFLPVSHAQRMAFCGALLADSVDHRVLASIVIASPTNRANCLVDITIPGGAILDSDIDNWIAAKFTGIATSRSW